MASVEIAPLAAKEAAAAGELIARAHPWRFGSVEEAVAAVERARKRDPDGALAAHGEGGRFLGVAIVRRVGDMADIVALTAELGGQGIGGALLDQACACADEWGAGAIRARIDAGDAAAFALAAGRSFAVVDVAARLMRAAAPAPRLDAARGLEIGPPRPADLDAVAELDRRLTGLDRRPDLEAGVKLCARRRGALVGFLAAAGDAVGPAVALDVADLGVLIARALADRATATRAALSTAAPTAMLAAAGLGFRVGGVDLVISRGPAPPARPPQLYRVDF